MWGMPLHRMAVAWGYPDLRADLSPTPFFPLLRGGSRGAFHDRTETCGGRIYALYSLGYNLYTSGNYKDAETVFSGLCLYDHNDPRFWMGLAGSRQANGKYQEAVDAYGLCSAMGALASPVPLLQAGMCYLKMGDREKAQGAFVVALSMGEEGNPEHDAARGKASAMLAILEQTEK